jgi:hypothetical protein
VTGLTTNRRLDEIERRLGGDDAQPTSRVVAPPVGLTVAEHERWSAEQRREADARGEYSFTLDLGASVIQ